MSFLLCGNDETQTQNPQILIGKSNRTGPYGQNVLMIFHKKSKSSEFESHQYHASSQIREKGESQNGFFKKTKHAKFFEKRAFLTPDTHNFVFWKI